MTTACDDVSCETVSGHALRNVLVILLMTAGVFFTAACDWDCGIFSNPQRCHNAHVDPLFKVRLTLTLSAHSFTAADSLPVRVTATNISRDTVVIPTQVCSRPFYVELLSAPMSDPTLICTGQSYPGGTLAPGDSMSWVADIRSETWDYGKHLIPDTTYEVYGRVRVDQRLITTKPNEYVKYRSQ